MKKCKIKFEDVGINEILRIVNKINDEIWDQCGDEGILYRPITFECDGYNPKFSHYNSAWIKFFNNVIWSTEYSERDFNEEKNEYEPLEDYLRREVRDMLVTLSKIEM